MRSHLGLDIRQSQIEGAGLGLFAIIDMVKGHSVVDYDGDILTEAELISRYGDATAPYALCVSGDCFIDCALRRGIGAYINASRQKDNVKTRPANVRFVVHMGRKTARFVAIRRIRAGQEILVAYGGVYWKDAARSSHTTSEFPTEEWDGANPFTPSPPSSCPSLGPSTVPPSLALDDTEELLSFLNDPVDPLAHSPPTGLSLTLPSPGSPPPPPASPEWPPQPTFPTSPVFSSLSPSPPSPLLSA
jgi:hypothetical protein